MVMAAAAVVDGKVVGEEAVGQAVRKKYNILVSTKCASNAEKFKA